MSNEQYRISTSVISAGLNAVKEAKNLLQAAQGTLESAGYQIERDEKRLGRLVFPLEGRKSFSDPINQEEAKKNAAALDLINSEREAAEDKGRVYTETLKHIRRALEELEE